MIRAQSIGLALAIAVAPLLSSCASRSLPSAATLPAGAPVVGTVALKKTTLTGTWTGSWDSGAYKGTFSMSLKQKGKTFSGPVTIQIKQSKVTGTIKGTIAKKGKLTLTVTAKGLGSGHGTATVNKTKTKMSGSVTFKSSSSSFSGTKK